MVFRQDRILQKGEEMKESELDKILDCLTKHGDTHRFYKKQIINLAKKKVEETGLSNSIIEDKLEGM